MLFIICFSSGLYAQQKTPKNYFGAVGVIELNRLAVSTGLEYERWLYTKDQIALGAKAHYIFPSKTIPGIFSISDRFERNSQAQIMATSYLFTSSEKETNGFFLSLAAGVNFIKWEAEAYDDSGNSYIRTANEVSPGFDLSMGGQFKAKHITTRVTAGYQAFPGNKYDLNQSGHGVSLVYLKISIGF